MRYLEFFVSIVGMQPRPVRRVDRFGNGFGSPTFGSRWLFTLSAVALRSDRGGGTTDITQDEPLAAPRTLLHASVCFYTGVYYIWLP